MKSKDKLIKAVSTYANRKGISVDAAVSELNKMSKDEINNIFNKMKLFKDGGKLDYLLCLKKGGDMKNCGCGGNVEKKQGGNVLSGGTVVSQNKKGDTATTKGKTKRGADFTIISGPSGVEKAYIDANAGAAGIDRSTYKVNPSLLGQIFIPGLYKMPADMRFSADSLVKSVPVQQDGGNLRRRDARENAAENRGMNRRQFRQAYRNVKNSLRENGPEGLRGRDLRQAARHAFDLYEPQPILPEIVIEDTIPAINNAPINLQQKPLSANYNFNGFSFNKAFRDARKLGLKTFNWRGTDFNTQLADLNSAPTVKVPTVKTNDPIIDDISNNQAVVSNPVESTVVTSDPWGEAVKSALSSWTNPTTVQQSPDVTSNAFKLNNANFRRNRISFARFK